jgi:hypothetical protein
MSMPLISWFMNRATTEQSLIAADTAHRRASRNYQDALDDTVDQFTAEIRAHNALKERHARLERRYDQVVHVLHAMADANQTFRLVMKHLSRQWTPADPAERSLAENLTPLIDKMAGELDRDPTWIEHRDRWMAEEIELAQREMADLPTSSGR